MAFKQVGSRVDFSALEREILQWWYESGVVKKYLEKNKTAKKKFSFLDGPITANNPMGVHHAWGRTYKDLWQRYHTLKGDAGRYQNGFDCQGLWVEVEVERELGFKSKRDIEAYGVANFVNKCKERVYTYSAIQTEQSKRLGMFMDWDNSYFTMSDENNYAIWHFLKVCWERGWLYKGHDSIPWCPRCETAISQHEILTEDYQELTHESIYLELPLVDHKNEYLLVWTTTPWTLPANIAVAVGAKLEYSQVVGQTGDRYWVASSLVEAVFKGSGRVVKKTLGKSLVGWKYRGPFDHLPAVKAISGHPLFHTVVAADKQIMPVTTSEGTGLIHTAVSAGEEDFKLGRKLGLPLISVIADNADYLPGLGEFSNLNAKNNPRVILDYLEGRDRTGENWIFEISDYTHRYPVCWRCRTELVWKVADEWYIAMDRISSGNGRTADGKLTLRKQMIAVAKKINWLPKFGLERELDWLKNMHDWLISKKNRYWGLALPIYECSKCGHFEVIGGEEELKQRAVTGWDKFTGNSPHRPWVDEVKIKCSRCDETVSRIADVGNPWLDAGIVPFSTLPEDWFPADFITESFPGQFKNWFYSMIAMSTVLKKTKPFQNVLGFELACGLDGQIMHKSNPKTYISFEDAAEKAGSDVLRWIFVTQNPEKRLLFGWSVADETRRKFHLMLWNVYNFFVTYANIDEYNSPLQLPSLNLREGKGVSYLILDRWILARLNQTIDSVTLSLNNYDAYSASHSIEEFVSDLSLWYVRRSRDRVGPTADDSPDKTACHSTLHYLLTTISRLLAPFTPFIAEEIYGNLTGEESVHLSDWPKAQRLSKFDLQLIEDMKFVRKIVEMGLSERKKAKVRVRQPLRSMTVNFQFSIFNFQLIQLIKDELNVKEVVWGTGDELKVTLDLDLDSNLVAEGEVRELIRQVQELRKAKGARLDQKIKLTVPVLPAVPEMLVRLKRQTLAADLVSGRQLEIELI